MGVNSEGRAPRLLLIITVLLLVLAALLVWLMVIPEPSAVAGLAHPDQPGMNVGGDGLARLGIAGPMLLWLQTVVLLLIHALVALGVSPARRGPARQPSPSAQPVSPARPPRASATSSRAASCTCVRWSAPRKDSA